MLQHYRGLLLMLLALTLLMAAEPWLYDVLRFDRLAIVQGQWWRLLTAHWLHLSWPHLLMNSAGLALCFYIAGRGFQGWEWSRFLLFSLFITGAQLFVLASDLYFYVGLSGVLHGLLVLALYRSPHYPAGMKWLVLVLVCSKVVWEQSRWYDDMAMLELIDGRVEARAHLYGLISGLIWCGGDYLQRRWRGGCIKCRQ